MFPAISPPSSQAQVSTLVSHQTSNYLHLCRDPPSFHASVLFGKTERRKGKMSSLCLNCTSVPVPPSVAQHPTRGKELGIGRVESEERKETILKPIVVHGNPPTFVSAPGRRIVAVGDLHGDIEQTRMAFEMAGVLDSSANDSWTGGGTVLIQLGDILDRGEDEIAILSLLRSLNIQAKAAGGGVFQINGNHETMNIEGDFRYVLPGGYEECTHFLDYLRDCNDDWERAFVKWIEFSETGRRSRKLSRSPWRTFNPLKNQRGSAARSFLLKPGGPLASELANHSVILKVNDWVFCHGGLLPHHVMYGMEKMNHEVSCWMRGGSQDDSSVPKIPFIAVRGYDSVVWNRLYSRDETVGYTYNQICGILEMTLQEIGARGMVVGHTPQEAGANCKYKNQVWRIDVGMSSGVLNSSPEVLEIVNDQPHIIKKAIGLSDVHEVDHI